MTVDDQQFLDAAVELGILSNAQAAMIQQEITRIKGRKTAAEVAKGQRILTDAQVGTILSSMYSRTSDQGGAQTVGGEHCVNHPERLATRSCHRCGKPLCPSCGLAEDGFVFCGDECLDDYRIERDSVEAEQLSEVRRRKVLLGIIGAVAVGVILLVGIVAWVVAKSYMRKMKGQKLFQEAQNSRGLRKVELIEEALTYKPDIEGAREHIPQGYMEAKEYAKAEQSARDVLTHLPNNAAVKKVLAKSLIVQGKVDDALALFSDISSSLSLDEVRSLGISLFTEHERPEEALPWLTKALSQQQEDRQVSYLLGKYCLDQGEVEKAIEHLKSATNYRATTNIEREREYLTTGDGFRRAALALAEAAYQKEDYGLLKELLEDAKRAVRMDMGGWDVLVEILEKMVPLASDQEIMTLKGETLGVERQGSVEGLNRLMGVLEARQGNMSEAAGHLEKALQDNPDDMAARKYLVSFYLDQALYRQARNHYEKLRASGSEGFEMKLWEARLLKGEGQTDKALALAESILAEKPDVAHALAISAEAHLQKDEFMKGWKRLDTLCQVKPGPWAYLKAFLAAWRLGAADSAGLYSTRLSSVAGTLPTDQAQTLTKLTEVFSGEKDPTIIDEHYMKARIVQLENPANGALAVMRKVYEATSLFSYLVAAYSGLARADLAAELQKFNTTALPNRNEAAYDPQYLAPVADRMREGVSNLIRLLSPYGGGGAYGYDRLQESMGKEYALAENGPQRVAVCATTMRNAGYIIYYNLSGGQKAAMEDTGFRLMVERHRRENSIWSGYDRAVIALNQALESLAFVSQHLPYGFVTRDAIARMMGDEYSKMQDCEDAHNQMVWQFYYLARIIWSMNFTKNVALVEGALGRRVR